MTGRKGKIETPPNKLARIVPKEGGKYLSEIMRDVSQAVQSLEVEYREHLAAEIAEIEKLNAAFQDAPDGTTARQLFRLAHDMRGQGGTFGFPLITEVSASLCRYITKAGEAERLKPELVGLHVNALQVIQREQITGGGDTLSQQVVAALDETVTAELDRLSRQD